MHTQPRPPPPSPLTLPRRLTTGVKKPEQSNNADACFFRISWYAFVLLLLLPDAPQVGDDDIKALVEDLDARVDLQDQDGWTCLHWAAQQGRASAARAVFEAMAGLASEPTAAAAAVRELRETRDSEGKTAEDVAREGGLESGALEAFLGVLEDGGGAFSSSP